MNRLVLNICLILIAISVNAQIAFDPDTVTFIKVSPPDLSGTFKNELVIDQQGILWVATPKGLYTFDGYDWKDGMSQSQDPLQKIDQYIEGLVIDEYGSIWFSTHTEGIFQIDPQTTQIKSFRPSEFSQIPIHDASVAKIKIISGSLYDMTFRGFLRFDIENESFLDYHIPFPDSSSGYHRGFADYHSANAIHDIVEDRRDSTTLWLGTRLGLLKYQPATQTTIEIDWPYTNDDVDITTIIDLYDSGDSILIGTYGQGIITYTKSSGTFRKTLIEPNNQDNREFENVIQHLRPVNDSIFLFASNVAPGIYNWKTNSIHFFNIRDEHFDKGHYRNIIIDSLGHIWTNSLAGIFRSKTPLFETERNPILSITRIKIAEQLHNQYRHEIDSTHELDENQNTLEFTYALVNSTNPKSVKYEYQLKGFDRNWINNEHRRFVRFANLPGGKYQFNVRATDYDGRVYQSELYQFRVHRPFYKSPWFLVAVLIGIFSLIWYVYHLKSSRKQAAIKLQSDFDLQLSKMEMQALRSQMNPHFIFNSLNSIKNYVVNKGPDEAADYLTKFAQLIRVILENSKSELLTLEQEIRALELYVDIENLRFTETFHFQIKVDPEINQSEFKLPPMLIQPHVENAIWHGLMHKKGNRNLNVHFVKDGNGIICTVEDDGIGRKMAAELTRTRKHKKQSLGTKITRDRIDMMNRLYNTQVRTEVIDLEDDFGNPLGTKVIIHIPQLNNNVNI